MARPYVSPEQTAKALKTKGYPVVMIANMMKIPESSVRRLLLTPKTKKEK